MSEDERTYETDQDATAPAPAIVEGDGEGTALPPVSDQERTCEAVDDGNPNVNGDDGDAGALSESEQSAADLEKLLRPLKKECQSAGMPAAATAAACALYRTGELEIDGTVGLDSVLEFISGRPRGEVLDVKGFGKVGYENLSALAERHHPAAQRKKAVPEPKKQEKPPVVKRTYQSRIAPTCEECGSDMTVNRTAATRDRYNPVKTRVIRYYRCMADDTHRTRKVISDY